LKTNEYDLSGTGCPIRNTGRPAALSRLGKDRFPVGTQENADIHGVVSAEIR
jgi:hypothetical protein